MNSAECPWTFKWWPIIAILYFYAIRVVELKKINQLLSSRRLHILFLGIFFPSFLILTVLGFVWFFQAAQLKCSKSDGLAYFLTLILSMVRCFMLIMLGVMVLSTRIRARRGRNPNDVEGVLIRALSMEEGRRELMGQQ